MATKVNPNLPQNRKMLKKIGFMAKTGLTVSVSKNSNRLSLKTLQRITIINGTPSQLFFPQDPTLLTTLDVSFWILVAC